MRLIDADALKNMRFSCGMHDDDYVVYAPIREVMENIDKAPTVSCWISVKDRLREEGEIGMNATEKVINDLNVAKLMLSSPQILTPEIRVKIGQTITSAIDLLTEHGFDRLFCEPPKEE